jgi:uroporphyrinogen decarboxylase
MAFNEPDLLHAILKNLADSIGEYALYQVENGAQLIQIFDSWEGHLSPKYYDGVEQGMVVCCVCRAVL